MNWQDSTACKLDISHPPNEELCSIYAAIDSFRQYAATTHLETTHRRRQNFYALPTAQWQRLAGREPAGIDYLGTLELVDDAIDEDAKIAHAIVESALSSFVPEMTRQWNDEKSADLDSSTSTNKETIAPPSAGRKLWWHNTATPADLDKARATVRQFYRDWSSDGALERSESHAAIHAAIQTHLPYHAKKSLSESPPSKQARIRRGPPRILIPGAGLGRLVADIHAKGYFTEGNEISYHQLLASNWILNHVTIKNQYTLHPFLGEFTNVVSRAQQLRKVKIPDYIASCSTDGERMRMTAADFIPLYMHHSRAGSFDAVVSVFFIDTAPNLATYMDTIWNCLCIDGVWINKGPLLWHFDGQNVFDRRQNTRGPEGGRVEAAQTATGIKAPGGIELSLDEILLLLPHFGFELLHLLRPQQGHGDAGYMFNEDSMLQRRYRTVFWVARKIARV